MSKVLDVLRTNLPYEFIAAGVVWGVFVLESVLVLWPALTCIAAGLLLKFRPSGRITLPWATSSAVLGFFVAAFQVYVSIPFVSGIFSTAATETLAVFTVFALFHVWLAYSGYSPAAKPVK